MLVVDIVRGLRIHAQRRREREREWKQEEAGVEEEGRARKGCGH